MVEGLIWLFSWHLDALHPSVTRERLTIGCLTLPRSIKNKVLSGKCGCFWLNTLRASVGDAINQHPSIQCPKAKPPCLGLADSQCGGDFSHRKSILKKRSRLLQNRRTYVAIQPSNAVIFIRRNCAEPRFERNRSTTVHPIPKFFKMDLEFVRPVRASNLPVGEGQ